VVVDLETFDVGARPVILSIGAVAVDIRSGQTRGEFYRLVDPSSAVQYGLTLGVDTILWWMQQSDAARQALTNPSTDRAALPNALHALSTFFRGIQADTIWSNGALADLQWLGNAYRACNMTPGWTYRQERDLRTLWGLVPVPRVEAEVEHDALSDAKAHAQQMLAALAWVHAAQAVVPLDVGHV
jgi:hypothetical protein